MSRILTIGTEVVIRDEKVKIIAMTFYWATTWADSELVCTFERADGTTFKDVYYHIERAIAFSS